MVVVVPAPLVATEATDMTLVEFLLARIAEDEASIRADLVGREWPNPRRSRAECEAKRRIVGMIVAWGSQRPPEMDDEFPVLTEVVHYPLRALAAVYADHADYRPEWKP